MSLEPVPSPATPATMPQRLIHLSPRRIVAGLLFTFSTGFLVGYWFHQPAQPHDYAATLDAIHTAQAKTDELLTQQRQILNCLPTSEPPSWPTGSTSQKAMP